MNMPTSGLASRTYKRSHAPIRVAWLLFAFLALCLALPGISPYVQLLATICQQSPCLPGQLGREDAQAIFASGQQLSDYAQLVSWIILFIAALFITVAAFLIWRKPDHPAAVVGAFVLTAVATSTPALALAQFVPSLLLLAQLIWLVQLGGLAPFLCLLPDGTFRPRWLRWLALVYVFVCAAVVFAPQVTEQVQTTFFLASCLIVAFSLFYRYFCLAGTAQQDSMVWALTGVALAIGAQMIGTPMRFLPLPTIPLHLMPLSILNIYPIMGLLFTVGSVICLALALLGDDMFEMEIILNRALVYSSMTIFAIVTYVLLVNGIANSFALLLNSDAASTTTPFALLATGLIALAFQPLREWLQRHVNRWMYGQRDEPVAVLTRLGERLAGAQTPDALLPDLAATVAQSLKLPHVAIAVRQGSEMVTAATFSLRPKEQYAEKISGPSQLLVLPLIHHNELIGELSVAPRSANEAFSAADRELLTNIARQAGAAVSAVQLSADLQRSRQQLVSAIEEERRRLRRDLHDGLGPLLAALILKSEVAHDLVRQAPAEAERLMVAVADEAQAATSEIRRLVHDLRPPALDDLGLVSALRSHAARYSLHGVEFCLEAPDTLPPLSAAVEVAAYRIACEAMNNVMRHAQAKHCWIVLSVAGALTLSITDDGRGLRSPLEAGVGILSMRERCAELGGILRLEPAGTEPGPGVRVSVILPLENSIEQQP